jgi:RimJ/RimL family protein N-acetyltransferase
VTKAVARRHLRRYKGREMSLGDESAVEIRPAEPADGAALIGAIEQIDRETEFLGAPGERLAWAERPDAALARLRDGGGGIYLVARQAGAIVGYVGALAGQYRSTRGVLSIQHIGVRQAQRRHAIATRLLDGLEAWARARAAHRIDLTVDQDNAPARALYRKHLYDEEGVIREAARDGAQWRSYVALAKLLDGTGSRAMAMVPVERRGRADSLTVRFRSLVETDAVALCGWERALLAAAPPSLKQPDEVAAPDALRESLRGLLASELNYLVAALIDETGPGAETERLVGLLAVSAKPQQRLQPDLALVVNVLAEYRGLGIGRRLFEIGERWARARGAHRLSTSVHAANGAGLGFVAALGFAPEVRLRRYARFGALHVDLLGFAKHLPDTPPEIS